MKNKFYITTAIDYINDIIHIGHGYQKIVADVLARYHRLLGDKVFFLTGVDEHGSKAETAAKNAGLETKDWCDKISQADEEQLRLLNISFGRFIRTSDTDHKEMVADFWRKVEKNGDIYLGEYTGIYCEGCEAFITEKDLVDGKCLFHPQLTLKKITEENYFFRWSKYKDFLKDYIKNHPKFVLPESRKNEMLNFLEEIKDIPVSRPSVKWGIPVPGNPKHTIYVWFDALINYISGAPKGFWPADVHLLGKDNARWHSLLWPAMLKSAGYEFPKTVYVHGFISLNGQKISKSLGNIIRPSDLVKDFGADPIRYYLLKIKPLADDGDISVEKIKEVYNGDLANGIGNLFERVFTMIIDYQIDAAGNKKIDANIKEWLKETDKQYKFFMESYNLCEALKEVFAFASKLDKYIDDKKPWVMRKNNDAELEAVLTSLFFGIEKIIEWLEPFMPAKMTDAKNYVQKIKSGKIGKEERLNLFPRIV